MHTSITRTVFQTTVFSDGPRGGNPCPVVLDADELSTQQGMSLAEKFTAETIFITTAKNPRYDFGLRYFVPHHEMEMCVHGTIAAVTVLRALERITSSPVQVETVLGQITVEWLEQDENLVVTVHQFAPDFSAQNPSNVEVCEVLRLPDISSIRRDLPIISVSTSRHKLIVPLDSVQRLDRLLPDFEALWSLCDRFNTTGLYPFALDSAKGKVVYAARQFPRRAGYNEDPATGVAACALGAYLGRFHSQSEGWHSFEILQGRAMNRPSRLTARVLLESGAVCRTSVIGKAEILNHGSIPIAQ